MTLLSCRTHVCLCLTSVPLVSFRLAAFHGHAWSRLPCRSHVCKLSENMLGGRQTVLSAVNPEPLWAGPSEAAWPSIWCLSQGPLVHGWLRRGVPLRRKNVTSWRMRTPTSSKLADCTSAECFALDRDPPDRCIVVSAMHSTRSSETPAPRSLLVEGGCSDACERDPSPAQPAADVSPCLSPTPAGILLPVLAIEDDVKPLSRFRCTAQPVLRESWESWGRTSARGGQLSRSYCAAQSCQVFGAVHEVCFDHMRAARLLPARYRGGVLNAALCPVRYHIRDTSP